MNDNSDSLHFRKDKVSFDENVHSAQHSRSNSRRNLNPLTPFQGQSQNSQPIFTNKNKMKIVKNNLLIYNCSEDLYCIKLINDIIYDEKKHILTNFKEHLIWYETSDYLKRVYDLNEAVDRIPKIAEYYEMFSVIPPNYANFSPRKTLQKNIRKKKKVLERLEELENNRMVPECRKNKDNESDNPANDDIDDPSHEDEISNKKQKNNKRSVSQILSPSMLQSNILKGDISFSEASYENSFFDRSILNFPASAAESNFRTYKMNLPNSTNYMHQPNQLRNQNISVINKEMDIYASTTHLNSQIIKDLGIEDKRCKSQAKIAMSINKKTKTTKTSAGTTDKTTKSSSRNFYIQQGETGGIMVTKMKNVAFNELKKDNPGQQNQIKLSNFARLNNDDIIKKPIANDKINYAFDLNTKSVMRPNTSLASKINVPNDRFKKTLQANHKAPSKESIKPVVVLDQTGKKSTENFSKLIAQKSTFESSKSKILSNNTKAPPTSATNKIQNLIGSSRINVINKEKKVKSNEEVKPVMIKEKIDVRHKPSFTPVSVYSSNNSNVNSIPNTNDKKANKLILSIKSPVPPKQIVSASKKPINEADKVHINIPSNRDKNQEVNEKEKDLKIARDSVFKSNKGCQLNGGTSRFSPSIICSSLNSKILSNTITKTTSKIVTANPTPTSEKKDNSTLKLHNKESLINIAKEGKSSGFKEGSSTISKEKTANNSKERKNINTVLGKERTLGRNSKILSNQEGNQYQKNNYLNNINDNLAEMSIIAKNGTRINKVAPYVNNIDNNRASKANLEQRPSSKNSSHDKDKKKQNNVEYVPKLNANAESKPDLLHDNHNSVLAGSTITSKINSVYKGIKVISSSPSPNLDNNYINNYIRPNIKSVQINKKDTLISQNNTPANIGGLTDRATMETPISPPLQNSLVESSNLVEDNKQGFLQNRMIQVNNKMEKDIPIPVSINNNNNKFIIKDSGMQKAKKGIISSSINTNILNSRNIKSAILKNDTLKSSNSPGKSGNLLFGVKKSEDNTFSSNKDHVDNLYKKCDLKSQSKVLSVDNKLNKEAKLSTFDLHESKSKIVSGKLYIKSATKSPQCSTGGQERSSIAQNVLKYKDEKSLLKSKVESELNTIENNRQNITNLKESKDQKESSLFNNEKKNSILHNIKLKQPSTVMNKISKVVAGGVGKMAIENNLTKIGTEKSVKFNFNSGGKSPVF